MLVTGRSSPGRARPWCNVCSGDREGTLCWQHQGGFTGDAAMCGVSTWYCLDTDNTWSHNQSMEAVTLTLVSSGQMEHPCPVSGPRTNIALIVSYEKEFYDCLSLVHNVQLSLFGNWDVTCVRGQWAVIMLFQVVSVRRSVLPPPGVLVLPG